MKKCIQGSRYQSRKVWRETYGAIPRRLYVLHSCDNKFCINLNHLHLGTHKDNMREGVERNRFRKGNQLKWAKLDVERVRLVRQLLAEGQSQQVIADLFGVSQRSISKIKLKQSWRIA